MNLPTELLYSEDHHWVRVEGDVLRVGITDYAQDALGEVTLVQIAPPASIVAAGDELGEIEAHKAVSDLYMPVSGTVDCHNDALGEDPTAINSDPYGSGWICVIRPQTTASTAAASLLTAQAYQTLIGLAA